METTVQPATHKQAKYLDIVDSLRSDLQSGRYRPGARLPSEAELVRKFNVSRMTVVKAVQHLQQEGLLHRKPGSGSFAAEEAPREAGMFGLLIPNLGTTEIFEPICRGMMRSPSIRSHALSWGNAPAGSRHGEAAEQLCRRYIEQKVAGVFFAPLEFSSHRDDVNARILKALGSARIPVVLLDRDVFAYPGRSEFDLVGLDNRRAGFIMTSHLAGVGRRRIAFLARVGSAETVESRIAGYREALYARGLPFSGHSVLRGDASDAAFVQDALKDGTIDAILCANDHTAANLMQTLIGLGVRIPEDIGIAGVDDVKYASLLPIPLTTFHQPCEEIGAAAMSAMLERINNLHLPPRSIRLNGTLIVRRSCGSDLPSAAS